MMQAFARTGTPISPEQAIFMVLQLLTGLDYAHRKTDGQGNPLQIVHCDVSPDNALVTWEGEVKLLDFGIARAATGLSNYKEGMLMGKLGYVAPEQASLERRWDHRVDLFAAGILLYELLTKQKPFPRATDVESLVTSRKARVVPPSAIDPRLPRELDTILSRALAYDPEQRFEDARVFANALVDVLFPTPQSAIQELLGRQMQQVFAEKIARQRSARAHDPLIMKVLANLAEKQAQGEYERLSGRSATPASALAPAAPPAIFEPQLATVSRPAEPPRPARPVPPPRRGIRPGAAALAGVALAVAGAAGLHYGEIWLRPGVLVITSEPAGAEVTVDGARLGQVTPAVVEGVQLSRLHEVVVGGPGVRTVTLPVEPLPGTLVRRVHASLETALGSLSVESQPEGASVEVDGRKVGRTPVTVLGVRLDERHRIDLSLAGHDEDQFVVLPERDGTRFTRRLSRSPAAVPAPAKGGP
jgi:hypothetical protein